LTLVFLHEGLGSAELWRDFPQRIGNAVGEGIVVESRRGYGHGPPIDLPRRVTYMHEEAELLRAMDVSEPVLIGHSDGASIALIAAGSGMAVRGLVLIAPHVFVEERSVAGIAAAKEAYDSGDLRARLARWHDDVDGAFRGWNDAWLSAEFRDWDVTTFLPRIECPVLLIQAEDDPYGTLAQLEAIAADVSGPVERLVVAGRSHAPHLDHDEEVLGAIVRWLPQRS